MTQCTFQFTNNMSALPPNNNPTLLIDMFISYATAHLSTVGGTIVTVSTYPPLGTPGPAVIPWTGYMVAPASFGGGTSTGAQPEVIEPLTGAQQLALEQTIANGGDMNEAIAAAAEVPDNVPDPPPNEIEEVQNKLEEQIANDIPDPDVANTPEVQLVEEASIESGEVGTEPETNVSGSNEQPIKPKPPSSGSTKGKYHVPSQLVEAMNKFGVGKTPLERAHFLAQCAHESGGFTINRESLKYSAQGLINTFKTYFNGADGTAKAKEIEYNEEKIGNYVYQRKTLGNINTGDGFKFLGRGWIQITGRDCYKEIGKKISKDLENNPKSVEDRLICSETACAYWKLPKFSGKCKDDSEATVKLITYYVNGGYNGLTSRIVLFKKFWAELKENPNAYT